MPINKTAKDILDRYHSLRTQRQTWESHWQEVADNMLPRKADITKSKIQDLKRYGSNPFTVGYIFTKNNQFYGKIDSIIDGITGYTIEAITYYDLPNGKTFYVMNSNGLTANDFDTSMIVKNEQLLDFVMAPQIQTDVYVERGKYSAFESIERLGEVDNMGDLERYGYGFFKINTT